MNTSIKDEIEQKLKELESFHTIPTPIKTEKIKRLFASFYKYKPHHAVYANRMGDDTKWELIADEQEWLFDLITVEEEESGNVKRPFITRTILSLESEFNGTFTSVIDDFQKLLTSNSDHKILVFNCHSDEFQSWTSYMETNIRKYKSANGIFYLISFLNDEKEFKIMEIIADNSRLNISQ